jgi:hypothetical protein
MPAVSEKQRRFMGMVLAYKRGKLKRPSPKIKEAAGGMSEQSVSDFASTGRKRIAQSLI